MVKGWKDEEDPESTCGDLKDTRENFQKKPFPSSSFSL